MAKKGLLLLVILSLLFTMASCGLDYRYQLDESKHNVFEVYWEDEDTNSTYFVYQGEKYVHTEESDVLNVYTDEYPFSDDILICWNGHRYIWYIDEYYSNTDNNPLFIYNSRLNWVYFRENYDYKSDIFVVEGTDLEIVWNDIFDSTVENVNFISQNNVSIYSKQCPRIKTSLELSLVDGQWFIRCSDSKEIWIPSNEFLEILSDNVII